MFSTLRRLWNCLFNRMAVLDNFAFFLPPYYALEMTMLVRALNVAVELDIADKLHKRKMSVDELAAETGMQVEPLYRILRALTAFGYFWEEKGKVFSNTRRSDNFLRSDSVGSMKDWILFITGEEMSQLFRHSLDVVRRGQSGSEIVFGKNIYDVLYSEPGHEKARDAFVRGMGKFSEWQGRLIAQAYDFKSVNKVVDVAGGHGFLISRLLQAYPHLKGAMVDRSFSIEQAQKTLANIGVADRCQLIAGDIFDAATLPNDGDLYTIKHVLWDWDDANALKILQSIRKVIPRRGKLMIIENSLSSDNNTDGLGKLFDLETMFCVYGKSRTKEEWAELTRAAGFSFERIKSTVCFDVKLMTYKPID